MKILVFSDIRVWKGYKEILKKISPDVVVLAGDLISDGWALFWKRVEELPNFKKEVKPIMKQYEKNLAKIDKRIIITWEYDPNLYPHINIPFILNHDQQKALAALRKELFSALELLEKKHMESKDFINFVRQNHIYKFYDFLRYAGEKADVLVVKGDHDNDFEGEYDIEKINNIPGCKEISSKMTIVNGIRFLGLGFDETHYLRKLRPLIEEFKQNVDIVITHCKQNRTPIVSSLKPELIIRGHFGSGKYLVNKIPAVFTADVFYTVISFDKKSVPQISQYVIDRENEIRELKIGSCRPWMSQKSEFEMYGWLESYPS